jgi:hypothetical protein
MPQQILPEKPQRTPHLLVTAALLLFVTFGIVFTAILAHALLARHQSFMQAHQSQQMRLRSPHEEQCPGLSQRAPSYHHAHRDRLTVGTAVAPGCLPASARWV